LFIHQSKLTKLQKFVSTSWFLLNHFNHQLTNTLQRQLNEVRREKALLEAQIERERSDLTGLRIDIQQQGSGILEENVEMEDH
jgi:hypothetical protein